MCMDLRACLWDNLQDFTKHRWPRGYCLNGVLIGNRVTAGTGGWLDIISTSAWPPHSRSLGEEGTKLTCSTHVPVIWWQVLLAARSLLFSPSVEGLQTARLFWMSPVGRIKEVLLASVLML